MPKAQWLRGDPGYDVDWFRDPLQVKGIEPCIPGWRSRNEPIRYDKRRYRRRSRIEIMFGRLKNWRRIATPLRPVANRLLFRGRSRCHRHRLAVINTS